MAETLYAATVEGSDDDNGAGFTFVGVFTTEARAREAVKDWRTATVEPIEVDAIPDWIPGGAYADLKR